uniref:Pre-mRNA-splicing factor ISY1 n=1 Tax=Prasinoderma singulare TaxID=676789 RepID=A0A7S3FCT5_9VIRI
MARPEEQKHNMMNRWLQQKAERLGLRAARQQRPFLADEAKTLADAEKWRADVTKEIGRKVQEIQNEGLDEGTLRDLNDAINKLVRTRWHWERRVKELGGAKSTVAQTGDSEQPADGRTYRYYGAAKNLPGVRELMVAQAKKEVRRNRKDLYKIIDGDYYGFRDEEDGVLLAVEAAAEKEAIAEACAAWDAAKAAGEGAAAAAGCFEVDDGPGARVEASAGNHEEQAAADAALVDVEAALPDAAQIEAMVVQQRKRALMAAYASEDLAAQESDAKRLMGGK